MTLLQRYIIFEKIKPELLKNIGRFGAVYDGWSHQDEHYLAIFATYLDGDGVVKTPMLSCSVGEDMDEDTIFDAELGENEKIFGFTANDLFDHLMLTFNDEYDLRLPDEHGNHAIELTANNLNQMIGFFVADNCNANRAMSDRSEIPMVGDATHRLNLAVETDIIGPKEKKNKQGKIILSNSDNRQVVIKVDRLMG